MYETLVAHLRECAKYDKIENTFDAAADAIEELSAQCDNLHDALIALDAVVPRWIAVTERLPEKEDEAVIVWEKQGFALIDWRHDNKWAILDNNYGIATHWMPLPAEPCNDLAKPNDTIFAVQNTDEDEWLFAAKPIDYMHTPSVEEIIKGDGE